MPIIDIAAIKHIGDACFIKSESIWLRSFFLAGVIVAFSGYNVFFVYKARRKCSLMPAFVLRKFGPFVFLQDKANGGGIDDLKVFSERENCPRSTNTT